MTITSIASSQLDRVAGGTASNLPLIERYLKNAAGEVIGELYHLEPALLKGLKHIGRIKKPGGGWEKLFNHYPSGGSP